MGVLDKKVDREYLRWYGSQLEDRDLSFELERIKDCDDLIFDRFYKDLEFGTGGLRGIIGVGTNRINIYTVAKATQGYANYLNAHFENPVVAIAYDSRIKSDLFAKTASEVFTANRIHVEIYRELMPTPLLSHAIRYLGCSGGVVITASHNPAKYNGYKVYGPDGGQITTAVASEILSEIKRVDIFKGVLKIPFKQAVSGGLISYISDHVVAAFIHTVSREIFCNDKLNKDISIVYTPLNGSGRYCVTQALSANGFTNIGIVKEQEQPDGNFPTCPYPNPEVRDALKLGIDYAERLGSELVLATDPDCDRVGVAVKQDNSYALLTGNEMGVLLFDYICKRRIELGRMPKQPILVKTIVTTDMVKPIAATYGVSVIDVLTGFKFIGEQIGILEEKGELDRYIFGFEESYGYLSGGYVRDKDAVGTSLLICEMFAYYKAQDMSLYDVLYSLYEKYGFYFNLQESYEFEGEEGFKKMERIMKKLRMTKLGEFGGHTVETVFDYKSSICKNTDGSETVIDLPKSNVLKFVLAGGASVVVRPSGTEPKLKVYVSVSSETKEKAEEEQKVIMSDLRQYFY